MSDKELLHLAVNQIQKIWCETFGLNDLNEDFIPHLQEEVKAYVGSDIHLKIGSLLKLIERDRLDFLEKIRPTLEEPNLVLDDTQGILFIKEFIDKNKNHYFVSVAKNYNGEWIFSSHTKREINNIKNKIQNSKIIYNKGFLGSEVAGSCDILESGGEVSKPSHLQIKYTANQDFGKNPTNIIPQTKDNTNEKLSIFSKMKNKLHKVSEGGALLFSRLPELPIIAKPELTDKALNIEATATQIIPQTNENKDNTKQKSPFFLKMKNSLCKVKEGLNIGKEKINNDEIYLSNENLKNLDKDTKDKSLKDNENEQDKNSNIQKSNKTLRKKR